MSLEGSGGPLVGVSVKVSSLASIAGFLLEGEGVLSVRDWSGFGICISVGFFVT